MLVTTAITCAPALTPRQHSGNLYLLWVISIMGLMNEAASVLRAAVMPLPPIPITRTFAHTLVIPGGVILA